MSTIHFVGGEKGGVGKSVFSRLLSQYCLDKALLYAGFDADQSHATLSRFYPNLTRPINLDSFESVDAIMEAALERDQQVLVDLPAQSERFLDRWIEDNGVLEMCKDLRIPFVYWYVVDDGTDSARLLEQFLNKYGDHLYCAVIKNRGSGSHFSLADAVLSKANPTHQQRYQAMLPELHAETMRRIDELSFSFWGAEHVREGQPHLSFMERRRTGVWLNKAYGIFDDVFGGLQR